MPTLAMFYFLAFIKLVISVLFLQICLLIAQIVLLNFPFHLFMFVRSNIYILPNSINIEPLAGNQNHMRMIPLPSNKGSLFKKLGQEFKKILKVSSPGNVIKSIIWGENLLQIMRNLLKTLEREEVNRDESSLNPSSSAATYAQETDQQANSGISYDVQDDNAADSTHHNRQ